MSVAHTHWILFLFSFVPKEQYSSISLSDFSFMSCFMSFSSVYFVILSTLWNSYTEIPANISMSYLALVSECKKGTNTALPAVSLAAAIHSHVADLLISEWQASQNACVFLYKTPWASQNLNLHFTGDNHTGRILSINYESEVMNPLQSSLGVLQCFGDFTVFLSFSSTEANIFQMDVRISLELLNCQM